MPIGEWTSTLLSITISPGRTSSRVLGRLALALLATVALACTVAEEPGGSTETAEAPAREVGDRRANRDRRHVARRNRSPGNRERRREDHGSGLSGGHFPGRRHGARSHGDRYVHHGGGFTGRHPQTDPDGPSSDGPGDEQPDGATCGGLSRTDPDRCSGDGPGDEQPDGATCGGLPRTDRLPISAQNSGAPPPDRDPALRPR